MLTCPACGKRSCGCGPGTPISAQSTRTDLQEAADLADSDVYRLSGRLDGLAALYKCPDLKTAADVVSTARYMVRKQMHPRDIEKTHGPSLTFRPDASKTYLEEAREYILAEAGQIEDAGPEFQRLHSYAYAFMQAFDNALRDYIGQHCAWCDGEGRCEGVLVSKQPATTSERT